MKTKNNIVLLSVVALCGCSTSYSVRGVDSYEPQLINTYNLTVDCKQYHSEKPSNDTGFCREEGFISALSSTSPSALQGEILIEKDSYFAGVSPGMILFLGLIPASSYSKYSIDSKVTLQDGGVFSYKNTYEVVQTWSSLNTIRAIFGRTVSQDDAVRSMLVDVEEGLFSGKIHNKSL